MKLRARLSMLFAAMFLAGAFLVLFESPASADNCKQLVNGIGDLADKEKMQDCLRTGSNWGRTIGTVVAVSGISTAVVGLSKPPPKPPEEIPDIKQDMDPCVRADRRAARLATLKAQLSQLEADVMREFQDCVNGELHFNLLFRDLKELQYQMWKAVTYARIGNMTYIGAVGTGLASLFYKTALPIAAKVLPEFSAKAAGVGAAIEQTLASGAAEFSGTWIPARPPMRAGDPGAPAVPGLSMGGFQMFTDMMARDIQKNLEANLQRLFTLYCEDAQQFNLQWEQWGQHRRQQISDLRLEINEERNAWSEDAAQCPKYAGQQPDVREQSITEVVEWKIPQANMEWGGWWFGGGTF